jgi:hypothetical protein
LTPTAKLTLQFGVLQQVVGQLRNNLTNQTTIIPWGFDANTPVQNDYDGDGKVDIAVWRESNGTWYIRKSSNGQLRQEYWGMTGDIPVPAFYRR